MILADFHTHTTFCDGKTSAEEMLLSAIDKGFKTYGFSSHSHLKFDESWNMNEKEQADYIAEIGRLKEKYKGKIRVLLGTEWDLYSDNDLSEFDYVIASCHCILKDGHYISVDEGEEVLRRNIESFFGGDPYAFTEEYFRTLTRANERIKPDFIGHFDLVTKYNKDFKFFDETDPRYTGPMLEALEKLVGEGMVFEINTANTFRHSATEPTVSTVIWLKRLGELRGKVIITSDAHVPEKIGYNFPAAEQLARDFGIKEIISL